MFFFFSSCSLRFGSAFSSYILLSVMYYFDLCGRPSSFSSGNCSLFFIKTNSVYGLIFPEILFISSVAFFGLEKSVTIVMESLKFSNNFVFCIIITGVFSSNSNHLLFIQKRGEGKIEKILLI